MILFPAFSHASRQVTLAWDANDSKPEGYRVFSRQSGEAYNYDHPIWEGTATTCTLIGLDDFTDYAFVVRAYDGNLESADSNEVRLPSLVAEPEQPEATSSQDDAEDLFLTPVLQTAAFSSADSNDTHLQTRWILTRESDGVCIMDLTSTSDLTELDVPVLMLEDNTTYSWTVRHTSAKGSVSDWSTPSRFTTGTSALDGDGNGIPDEQEVETTIDLDDNGVADAEQEDLRCVYVVDSAGQVAVSAPSGSGVSRITAMEATDLDTIGSVDRMPYDLPLGLVSFRLELEHTGGIARIRIYFSDPAPQSARWIKYDTINGWQDYSVHATFADDGLFVDLEIQDGGFGDVDGVENGIIIDPSGYGIANDSEACSLTDAQSSSGGGGGGCFISNTLWAH
ncbi:hypothetical protein DSCW_50090 [Desulfosarcina widdelii]|uniref:Fibronectin type-III domain-containing protein n=1 Tax=Desulfosarcina widdelii TaxID=947919 RepID=A0A5K7Z6G1_9BACT|nr:hypothetical protein DSCW_50090 [Desulfosarcina widdelii]